MPPRSNVITMLPAHLREEVERRMLENGFSDYQGLADWVRQQGHDISDDSVWRYGKNFQHQIKAAEFAMRHARALAEVAPDRDGLMGQALIQIIQQKVLSALVEVEQLDNADMARLMHAVADRPQARKRPAH